MSRLMPSHTLLRGSGRMGRPKHFSLPVAVLSLCSRASALAWAFILNGKYLSAGAVDAAIGTSRRGQDNAAQGAGRQAATRSGARGAGLIRLRSFRQYLPGSRGLIRLYRTALLHGFREGHAVGCSTVGTSVITWGQVFAEGSEQGCEGERHVAEVTGADVRCRSMAR